MADEAVCVGPSPSAQSYLNISAILNAVKSTSAQAVHPGYGFLSENTLFAAELEKMNVVFLGPNSRAIKAMGDKIESKRIANQAKVNCIPGYDGEVDGPDEAARIAAEIGYPVMIKASTGGGGKGMRIAWDEKEVREGYRLSKSEAKASFGDDRMLIEKFIDNPRHIEIQLLCDRHGNAIYLNERECSIQRRNQKVIEEAPSTFLDSGLRKAMGEQAVSLAKAVNYDSAGTVEFLVDSKRNFYFLEMNTRLQVEHPITECITGVDIVHQMLRVGKGHPLMLSQVYTREWMGFECRVYAEDPYKAFGLPSIGRLRTYSEPLHIPNVCCDSGVNEGSEISIYYDPMICKLVTYGPDRQTALNTMTKALDSYVIRGVTHNIPLLRDIVTEKRFVSGDISTKYLSEVYPDGFKGKVLDQKELDTLISVSASIFAKNDARIRNCSGDPKSRSYIRCIVTRDCSGFQVRMSPWEPPKHINQQDVHITSQSSKSQESLVRVADNFKLSDKIINHSYDGNEVILQLLDKSINTVCLQYLGTAFPVEIMNTTAAWFRAAYMPPPRVIDYGSICIAPMPGLVRSIAVKVGDRVGEGQELCILEAMKMQNSLTASRSGVIKKVNFKAGGSVSEGDILVELEKYSSSSTGYYFKSYETLSPTTATLLPRNLLDSPILNDQTILSPTSFLSTSKNTRSNSYLQIPIMHLKTEDSDLKVQSFDDNNDISSDITISTTKSTNSSQHTDKYFTGFYLKTTYSDVKFIIKDPFIIEKLILLPMTNLFLYLMKKSKPKVSENESKCNYSKSTPVSSNGSKHKNDSLFNIRYKTQVCKYFQEHGGYCPVGVKCHFAHGIEELRDPKSHPKFRSQICRNYSTTGNCSYGDKCYFKHFINDLPSTTTTVTTPKLEVFNDKENPSPDSTSQPLKYSLN
ncbi:LOW QUALITY PROTEIN: putative propionyl-CoA carboxylase alpha subunit [Schistosoma mansoni]|nr:LOW QUALITY PROTEIN: putative propionyl-CoA carboxylase alpha subunit [Schistosoma mansoni]|eukprot:XP_018647814.1 LOW QUALITY PROTEIN: putative propionyl-CoA carboxylase alpha subunit [Schistosoma mansoni]